MYVPFSDFDWRVASVEDVRQELNDADTAFCAFNPECSLDRIASSILEIVLQHDNSQVREEGLEVLRSGLVYHPEMIVDLTSLSAILKTLPERELLLAINLIGVAGDSSLIEIVAPFSEDSRRSVAAEARECMAELSPRTSGSASEQETTGEQGVGGQPATTPRVGD